MTAFARFLSPRPETTPAHMAIGPTMRLPEAECLTPLLDSATLPDTVTTQAMETARFLSLYLRDHADRTGAEAMMQAFPIDSAEGTALLCLADALLRIPDAATRDALIRDQIGRSDWQNHAGRDRPLFLNAATWAMATSSRLNATSGGLRGLVARSGAPFIRQGVDKAIRMMGEQFLLGETMSQAIRRSKRNLQRGFTYGYTILAESAQTADDALRAQREALVAIETAGRQSRAAALYDRPTVSLKLSTLHPRFEPAQSSRVMHELLPVLKTLATRAHALSIALTLEAEESDRLDLTLELFEALCAQPDLAGWNGLGMTVQAYDKRAMRVLDYLATLATRTGRRVMIRLVKGAYWQSEIRRTQKASYTDYPVYTRKCHSDVSFIACARRLLEAEQTFYPQFATHNAHTIGTIIALAGPYRSGHYEFQCLHGLGDTLYAPVVSHQGTGLGIPCRLHGPVGPDMRAMPYLTRCLLEAGTPGSFVNQVANRSIPVDLVIADPVLVARAILPRGAPDPALPLPADRTAPAQRATTEVDLGDEATLRYLAAALAEVPQHFTAAPTGPFMPAPESASRSLFSPADSADRIGTVFHARPRHIDAALNAAEAEQIWRLTTAEERACCLERMALALEQDRITLLALLVREAGKILKSAEGELREAIDFLRYYAAQLRELRDTTGLGAPLGTVLCISPWNFPLSVFTGQIAVALAAGNAVIAKPSEETPLIAARAVSLFLGAGLPARALQLLPGEGNVGASLVADSRIDGVMFTGSTSVAKTISRELLGRTGRTGQPVPLLSDTSGQNAMLVDSSAPHEQVVQDVLASAFDNAGQRSASLRILLIQEEGAQALIDKLKGAITELYIGAPDELRTDIGPVISTQARIRIEDHIERMKRAGYRVWQPDMQAETLRGHFVPPTLIEIGRVADIGTEIFGPVLHIRRFARHELDGTIDALNATGYALTFGVQSRIRSVIECACARSRAGNLYVNRAIIDASVGSQPFGGKGLSGSGPKSGGPLLLPRLMYGAPCPLRAPPDTPVPAAARALLAFLEPRDPPSARRVRAAIAHGLCGLSFSLPAIAGETNRYTLKPKGTVLCAGESWPALLHAVGLALGTGNTVLILAPDPAVEWLKQVSRQLSNIITRVDPGALPECDAMLIQRGSDMAEQAALTVTAREGMVVPVYDLETVRPEWLLSEVVVTVNTTVIGT